MSATETRLGGTVGAGVGTLLRVRQDVGLGTVRLNCRFGGPIVAKQ